jgi:hypothetical protein
MDLCGENPRLLYTYYTRKSHTYPFIFDTIELLAKTIIPIQTRGTCHPILPIKPLNFFGPAKLAFLGRGRAGARSF